MSDDTITKFLERVRSAQRSRSRELRLTIEEASELTSAIGILLNKTQKALTEIVNLQTQQNNVTDIVMDGGNFKK